MSEPDSVAAEFAAYFAEVDAVVDAITSEETEARLAGLLATPDPNIRYTLECWITGCSWTHHFTDVRPYSLRELDNVVVAHLWADHTVIQMAEEIIDRYREIEDHPELTQEQIEDRNAILRELHMAMVATLNDPVRPEGVEPPTS